MNEVDKTIEAICGWIQKELGNVDAGQDESVSNMTKALAELVSARAKYN